jgi:NAD(P)-dependent dehydrogenase (short-subunit alcohol dehydrogenase family)/acyl carrier protein
VFDADGIVDAFRTMQQARHIGKVVLRLDAPPLEGLVSDRSQTSALDLGKGAWLITGGLSGFGLACACWLAEHGVTNLILLGRRGANTPGADTAVDTLRTLGASVHIFACDVADAAALRQVFDDIQQRLPPLSGVLHAAAVFDDALLCNLTPERVRAVLAPKFLGAWNLHEATRQLPLKHFVMFSSVTTMIGNPGQGNYVAANAGLESLAALRRSSGLPAACLCWGPLGDVGYLTRNEEVRSSLAQRLGRPPLSVQQALGQFETLLQRPYTTAPAAFDWPTLARLLPSASTQRFALLDHGSDRAASDTDDDLLAQIAGKSEADVLPLVSEWVRNEVAQILSISAERIDPVVPLHDLGLDSLMAVELSTGLEQRFGIQLPIMMLNDAPTVDKIARHITAKLLSETKDNTTVNGHVDVVQAIARQHGESEEDFDVHSVLKDAQDLATQGVRLTE